MLHPCISLYGLFHCIICGLILLEEEVGRLEFSVRKLVISCGRLVLLSMEQEFIYRTYGSFKDLVNVYGNILEQWVKSEGIYCVSIKYATNCT